LSFLPHLFIYLRICSYQYRFTDFTLYICL
jgi:hypothetical protein